MLGDTRDRRAAAAASAQIKTWVKKHLGFDASASIMVMSVSQHRQPRCYCVGFPLWRGMRRGK